MLNKNFQALKQIIKDYKKQELIRINKDKKIEIKNEKIKLIANPSIKNFQLFLEDPVIINVEGKTFEQAVYFFIEKLLTFSNVYQIKCRIKRTVNFNRALFIAESIPDMEYYYEFEEKKLYFKNQKGVVLYICQINEQKLEELIKYRVTKIIHSIL